MGLALTGALCPARVPRVSHDGKDGYPRLAQMIYALSEPGGYFDSDNLISNETSYLQVSETLSAEVPKGGVYLGVGPDQNFTYIAQLRPRWAFILDVRRQNMLEHLLFNALFAEANDPYQYLCRLFSRPCPTKTPAETGSGIEGTLRALEAVAPSEAAFAANLKAAQRHVEGRLGVALTLQDRADLESVYRAFFDEQLDIRFRTHRRPWAGNHPSYATLLVERSPGGRFGHFLASAEAYGVVRDLERSGHVVPVVGDFAGPQALRAIGHLLRERDEHVSVFYLSNVEFYLLRNDALDRFAANLKELPLGPDSLFIRACFNYGRAHPAGIPGHRSTTLLQRIPRFLELEAEGAYQTYWDLCTLDYLHREETP